LTPDNLPPGGTFFICLALIFRSLTRPALHNGDLVGD